ncbi:MAG: ribonuclease III [Planctomycetota bacterium]|jgi:ribonuclease-3
MKPERLDEAERLLGHRFADRDLLQKALTHASMADSRLESNERLEFLGDAVLDIVVCEYLYRHYEDLLEGEMTKIKSSVVSRNVCAQVAAETGLDGLLRLGKGMSNREDLPDSVIAAVYESLIGALFLDGGLEPSREFILKGLADRIEAAAQSGHQQNFKSVLQHVAQQLMEGPPQYMLMDEKGPDHSKCFEVCVGIGARRFQSCWGPSKKQAEQQAALQALLELDLAEIDEETGEVLMRNLDETAVDLHDELGPLGIGQ